MTTHQFSKSASTTETRAAPADGLAAATSESVDIASLQHAIKNPTSATLTPPTILQLQRTHGNAFVSRLIARSQSQIQTGKSPRQIQREPSVLSSFHRMKPDEKQQFERCLYGGSPSAGVVLKQMLLQRLDFNLEGHSGDIIDRLKLKLNGVQDVNDVTWEPGEVDDEKIFNQELSETTDLFMTFATESNIPVCGNTTQYLSNLFLDTGGVTGSYKDDDKSGSLQSSHMKMQQQLRGETNNTPVPQGVQAGSSVAELRDVMQKTISPLFIKVTMEGYGHTYIIEQQARQSPEEAPQGYLHMSYIERYTLSEWESSQKSTLRSDLIKEHVDRIEHMLKGNLQVYNEEFMLKPEHYLPQLPKKALAVTFAATPFDPKHAKERINQSVGTVKQGM